MNRKLHIEFVTSVVALFTITCGTNDKPAVVAYLTSLTPDGGSAVVGSAVNIETAGAALISTDAQVPDGTDFSSPEPVLLTVCTTNATCDDKLFCSGTELCRNGLCTSGAAPCTGQLCNELARRCEPAAATMITLNPSTTFQTMAGWEVGAQAGEQNSGANFAGYKDQLFNLAVNDLGITRLKVGVRCGVEGAGGINNYTIINDDNDPNHINLSGFNFSEIDQKFRDIVMPMKKVVEAAGGHLWVTLGYGCNLDNGGTAHTILHAQNPDEYAEFVLAIYQHVQNTYHFVPDMWSVNEPDWQAKDFTPVRLGAATVKAAARLKANGFKPSFGAPETTKLTTAVPFYDQMVAAYPAVKASLIELSFHRYQGPFVDGDLVLLATRAKSDHLGTAMQELKGVSVDDLYKDLSVTNVVTWEQGTLAFPGTAETGGKYYGIANPGAANQMLVMQQLTKLYRQYFKFIHPGAVRMGASSTNQAQFMPVAFTNPQAKMAVVVRTRLAGTFSVRGLRIGKYGIKYTTTGEYDKNLPDQSVFGGQLLTTRIPADGCITVYAR